MTRRTFLGVLGAVAVWPAATRGQRPPTPVVGFLRSTSLAASNSLVAAFLAGLAETGFVEGRTVHVEYRSADGDRDRLPGLVAELIRHPSTVIVGNAPSALAAKTATKIIPIVFATGSDPVTDGLVTSLNRPGGNVTGIVFIAAALGPKRLELLHKLVPKATRIAMLANPNSQSFELERQEVQAAAHARGLEIVVADVRTARDIENALATFVQRQVGALLIGSGPFFFSNRDQLVELATRHKIPSMHPQRASVLRGGLMSYGASNRDAYRQAGVYVGRILKGEKPADLPVMRSTTRITRRGTEMQAAGLPKDYKVWEPARKRYTRQCGICRGF